MKRIHSLLLVPVAALALAACGGNGDDSGHHSTKGHSMGPGMGMSPAPATAGHNAQDVMFAQMMIQHHQGAIAMRNLLGTR